MGCLKCDFNKWLISFSSCFWVKNFGKSLEKVQKSLETGVFNHSEFMENLEFSLFRTFRKLQKNDVKIEFRKSQKTRSDSKTDSNVWFKVQNAGPYSKHDAGLKFIKLKNPEKLDAGPNLKFYILFLLIFTFSMILF